MLNPDDLMRKEKHQWSHPKSTSLKKNSLKIIPRKSPKNHKKRENMSHLIFGYRIALRFDTIALIYLVLLDSKDYRPKAARLSVGVKCH